jgi:hypothetical protein
VWLGFPAGCLAARPACPIFLLPGCPSCSAIFILLLAIPSLASRTMNAPQYLVAVGGGAVRKVADKLGAEGRRASGRADAAEGEGPTLGAAPSAEAAPAADEDGKPNMSPLNKVGAAAFGYAAAAVAAMARKRPHSQRQYDVVLPPDPGTSKAKLLWLIWAWALWTAAVVLVVLGAVRAGCSRGGLALPALHEAGGLLVAGANSRASSGGGEACPCAAPSGADCAASRAAAGRRDQQQRHHLGRGGGSTAVACLHLAWLSTSHVTR